MPTTIRIEVTQDLIDRGERNCPDRCPIALAFHLATGKDTLEVLSDCTRLPYSTSPYCLLPEIARDFILRFDHRAPVQPISFNVELL
jgi:hypothetical protein